MNLGMARHDSEIAKHDLKWPDMTLKCPEIRARHHLKNGGSIERHEMT